MPDIWRTTITLGLELGLSDRARVRARAIVMLARCSKFIALTIALSVPEQQVNDVSKRCSTLMLEVKGE